MLVIEAGMQHKLSSSWKNAYNTEFPVMNEDGLDASPSLSNGIGGDSNGIVSGLLKKTNGFSDVMGTGGLEQKIQELRAEKEAAERQKCPGADENGQDSPIDFSVKRRTSFSGSLTDDSVASSTSPNHMTDFGNTVSPPSLEEREHQHSMRSSHDTYSHHTDGEQQRFSGSPHDLHNGDFNPIKRRRSSPSPDRLGEDSKPGSQGKPLLPPVTSGMPPLINGLGMFPGLPANFLGNGSAINAFSQLAATAAFMDPRGKKANRPFKAYPKELLQMPLGFFGLPGMSPQAMQQNMESGLFGGPNGEEMMNLYNQQLQLLREKQLSSSKSGKVSPPIRQTSPAGQKSPSHNHFPQQQQTLPPPPPPHNLPPSNHRLSSPSSQNHSNPFRPHSPDDHLHHHTKSSSSSSGSHTPSQNYSSPAFPTPMSLGPPSAAANSINSHSSTSTLVSSTSPSHTPFSSSSSRKRPRSLPDDQKDAAYWERRRKNNDAAKRSRDARRAKEDEIAIRAALLEQENIKLRVEVAALKTETARLRCLLYNS